MDGNLECTKCNSVVYVESNWYGTSRRFKLKCKCNSLDILSNASYIETFDEAISRIKEWKQQLTTASTDTEKETKKHSKLPVYCVSECFLEYEEWCAKFEDSIYTELAESGADREMDFDSELEFDKRYEMYLNAR